MCTEKATEAILAIDTATEVCSVALLSREAILYEKVNQEGLNHAALIMGFCRETLDFAQDQKLHLVAIAVNGGPGSYTGLRIGASFAKGLCFGKHLPLIALSGLCAMASGYHKHLLEQKAELPQSKALLCPMIDARRMEVYCALYDFDGNEVAAPQAEIITQESFSQYSQDRKIYFFGNGALKCREALQSPKAHFEAFPSLARHLQELAFEAYDQERFADVAYWVPNYIKPYMALKSKNKVLSRIIPQQ